MKYLKVIFFYFALFFAISPAYSAEVRIGAAASMADSVRAIVSAYEKGHPGITIFQTFASSGTLAKQVSQGAPIDIYLSANPSWMEYLIEKGQISRESSWVIAHNSLVFIGNPTLQVKDMDDIAALHMIAIGSPRSVPAGTYSCQALKAAGIYGLLSNGKKLVLTKDVRQALLYADRKEVDGAFVYRTDALLARKTSVLFTVPEEMHEKISYLIGLTAKGGGNTDAEQLIHFFKSTTAQDILKKYGFETVKNQ